MGQLATIQTNDSAVAAHHAEAIRAIGKAETAERGAEDIEARLRLSREKVKGLRKELGL